MYGGRQDDDHNPVEVDLETVAHCLSEAQEALTERNFKSVDANVSRLVKQHGLPESVRNALAYGVLEAHVKLLEEIERRILGEAPMIFTVDQAGSVQGASKKPPPSGPLFSEALTNYVDLAVKDKGWRGQSQAQNEATFAMFQQVCGDLPVNTYTRRNLSDFYNTLRALPALYSKDKRWRGCR